MTRHRPGTAADSQVCFEVMEASIDDFGTRTGTIPYDTFGDPAAWDTRRALFS